MVSRVQELVPPRARPLLRAASRDDRGVHDRARGVVAHAARIGSEFMPKLDEGTLWVRATMPYTISFDEAQKIAPEVRTILRSFPEVTTVAAELGRPDDGTSPTGFYNCEFYVGLKPSDKWRSSIATKDVLIAQINEKLTAVRPGIIFNFTQPAQDAVDEASTGLKSSLAVKVFGPNLKQLETIAEKIRTTISKVKGISNLTIVRELGQPSLDVKIDRQKLTRYGLDVATINALIESAVGGVPATQVIQGERQFDLVVRMDERYRNNPDAIGRLLVTTPNGQRLPLSTFATLTVGQGPTMIYREGGARYIGVQYSVTGRDLGSAVAEARRAVAREVQLPQGYELQWGGEYSDFLAARTQMLVIVPMTLLLIFFIIFALYGNLKYPALIALSVFLTMPEGGLLALWAFRTNLSVSSGLGFLALFGISVQTGVIYISHANKLRRARRRARRREPRGRGGAVAADLDHRTGRVRGPATGGVLARHRLGQSASVRPGDRVRPSVARRAVDLPLAGALSLAVARGRPPGGVNPHERRSSSRTSSASIRPPASA